MAGAVLAALALCTSLRGAAACTALAIDGAATETGAAFAVENVDCDSCDFRLTHVPAREHAAGSLRPVYLQKAAYPRWVGYGRGEIYHPLEGQEPFAPVLHIPQVPRTFGYYESACPLMNDQGLGLAESSCAAMLLNRVPGSGSNRSVPVAFLDAATVMQLVLERCATARCGAELIGELCEVYGYLPFFGEPTLGVALQGRKEWDDAGEAFILADATGEAWVVHALGGVEGVIRSVWAAQRVPKGHVVVVPNEFVIGELPDAPNEDFLFSRNIFEAAKRAGLWDGRGKLHFSKAFSPDPLFESAPSAAIPAPLYDSLRKWRVQDVVAPSLKLSRALCGWQRARDTVSCPGFPMSGRDLPFSVKAERKLARRDIMSLMRDHYGGTEFDMTLGALAGPFATPFRVEANTKAADGVQVGQVPRGISILRSIYSSITETGPKGSRVWFAPDTAATSVYMPLDSRASALATAMHIGTYRNFTRQSAFWAFDFVANWMQLNYKGMSEEDVRPRQEAWAARIEEELAALKEGEDVGRWQARLQQRVVADWWQLADELVVKWNDFERFGASWAYPPEWSAMLGVSSDIHPIWVQPASAPLRQPAGYIPPSTALPQVWDHATRKWEFASTSTAAGGSWLQAVALGGLGALLFLSGFLAGMRRLSGGEGLRPLLA